MKYALNSESPTFLQDLEATIKQTSPTILFECVGGSLPGVIFKLMAPKSHMVVYGNLSQEQVSFDVSFHTVDKLISGIRMPRWTGSLSPEELRKWLQLIADDLEKNDGKVFGTKVIQEIGLENWK